jgi:hypothetical protein
MCVGEERDWRRFFKIFGPTGDRRNDENFAFLRKTLHECHGSSPPASDLRLEYDWKRCFPKEDIEIVEAAVNNIDNDMAFFERLGQELAKTEESTSEQPTVAELLTFPAHECSVSPVPCGCRET